MISLFVAIQLAVPAAQHASDTAEPYRILIQANRARDAALAASAYSDDAVLIFDHEGQPPEVHRGLEAIRQTYLRTFRTVPAGSPIELSFRLGPFDPRSSRQDGVYRVSVGTAGRPLVAYGRFSARLRKVNGRWRFAEDRGSVASAADFVSHGGRMISSH